VFGGCVAARGQDFALKRSRLTGRIMLLLDSRRFKDGRWHECLLLKLILSGPSELGAELSNCQDILWRDRSMPKGWLYN
jgi:hypothetical protein